MDIVFEKDGNNKYIENKGVVYLCGPNQCGKSHFLSVIRDGFLGKNSKFSVDGLPVKRGLCNVVYFDDTTDFDAEFKFTKSNVFRELIYDNVLSNINETKILREVNELFDKIDLKVNKFLDINLNNKNNEKVSFDIEIDDVNDIINKFTNIYIDNYLLKEDNIPRSVKRKLIYNLLLLELKKTNYQYNIIIIDDFDLYLDYENTYKTIKLIEDYHKKYPNTYFFLSTSNNIYEAINDKSSLYKIYEQNCYRICNLSKLIENVTLKYEYTKQNDSNIDFENFVINNCIFGADFKKVEIDVLSLFSNQIGKIYVIKNAKFTSNYKMLSSDNYIYCPTYFYELLFREIDNILCGKS